MECSDWSAWYNRMPGIDDPNLHVAGKCGFRSGSMSAELVLGNEGTIDEPDLIVLELRLDDPPIGDTQYVDREVVWEGDVGPDISRVRIQGATRAEIKVTIAV